VSWWSYRLAVGDHVRVRPGVRPGLLEPHLPRRGVGIVREVHPGLLRDHATVEFDGAFGSFTARWVPANRLRRSFGRGEEAWRRRVERRRGVRLGLLALNLPILYELAKYLAGGGTIAGLIPAVIGAGTELLLFVLTTPVVLGLLIAVVILGHARHRLRR
jgi:hypothetical protein